MKNLTKLIASVLLFFSFMSISYGQTGPAAPSNGVWMLIDTNYTVGTTTAGVTNAKLTYKNTTGSLITGLQFRVFYDKNAFSAAAVTLVGSSSNLDLQFIDNNANGYVTITVVYTGVSSAYTLPQGELFDLALTHVAAANFNVLPSIGNLTWTGVQTYSQIAAEQPGNDLALSLHNYGGAFIQTTFSFAGNFTNVTGTPAKNLPLSLEKKPKIGAFTWTNVNNYTTDNNGQFAFTETIDTTYYDVRLAIKGDTMDVGNVISVADAQQINQWVLGNGSPSGFEYYAADVNGSNGVSISDAYGVFGLISGRFTAWPNNVQNIKFFTAAEYNTITTTPTTNFTSTIPGVTNFNYPILANGPTSVTFYVSVVGDANNTGYHMARLTPIDIINPANAPYYLIDETVIYDSLLPSVEINVPSLSVNEGNLVEIPVKVITGDKQIGSLQLALLYDDNILEFKEVQNTAKAMNWLSFLNTQDNIIEWGGYDTRGNFNFTNGEVLFTLLFIAKSPQSEWAASPLYTSRKFVGDQNADDMNLTPTNGVIEVKMANGSIIKGDKDMLIYPNPTTGEITVNFSVEESGQSNLSFVDLQGRVVLTVFEKYMPKGHYSYTTDLSGLSNGIYITKLNTIADVAVDKAVLIK
jgi:hypothetical protein